MTRGRRRDAGRRFVVHEHKARRLHYDFRLELGGVLKSWAVPKGPSMNPADKRLAVTVPDHPLEYGDFEGVIPEGTYGAGPVVVWDAGTWAPTEPGDPGKQLRQGRLSFRLDGRTLRGGWVLTRLARGTGKDWLLIKRKDAAADPSWRLTTELTPRRLKQLAVKIPPCEAH
jgi:DNA ligase D-like protein (predicted 3'-phosphoesterase)